MAILTGIEIYKRIAMGSIECEPCNPNKIQPNSIDLTLGKEVCVYTSVVCVRDALFEKPKDSFSTSKWLRVEEYPDVLDVRQENPFEHFLLDESGWLLKPGILYLMHVVERLHAPKLVMALDGKSSLARLGITVHITAGHAETGFNGQYTLEVTAEHPVRIYPGMDIAQVIFHTVEGEIEDYKKKGHYVGSAALGAVPSRSYEQFEPRDEGDRCGSSG